MTEWHEEPNAATAFCIALEALRSSETAVMILIDDEDADHIDKQCAIECLGPWTDWKEERFYGRTPLAAILEAGREQARRR